MLVLSRSLYDRWQAFAHSRKAEALMFLWAAAEAIIFPIIPEFFLLALMVGGRRNFWRLFAASALGSVLGMVVLYILVYVWPQVGTGLLSTLPFATPNRLDKVNGYLDRFGVLAFFVQPWTGIDFKFFGIQGALANMAPWLALPLAVVSRAMRMFLAGGVVWVSARLFPWYYRNLFPLLAAGYIGIFGYMWYLVQTGG